MAAASQRGALDLLLDVMVYAPLGLAMRAAEEVPKLAAAGRERVSTQVPVARVVGKMAVAQGRRQVQGLLERRPGTRRDEPWSPAPSEPQPGEGRDVPIRDLGPDEDLSAGPVAGSGPVPGFVGGAPAGSPSDRPPGTPSAADLPIPGYDSLSASQVVQRLPGLSPTELEAVRAYEAAGRGRKTVLLRVAQLRAAS